MKFHCESEVRNNELVAVLSDFGFSNKTQVGKCQLEADHIQRVSNPGREGAAPTNWSRSMSSSAQPSNDGGLSAQCLEGHRRYTLAYFSVFCWHQEASWHQPCTLSNESSWYSQQISPGDWRFVFNLFLWEMLIRSPIQCPRWEKASVGAGLT